MFNLIIDTESKPYWEAAKNNKLVIQKCKTTGKYFLYSRRLNNIPIKADFDWVEVSGKGKIYSYTIAYVAAGEYYRNKLPYIVACIDLIEGARIITNLKNSDIKKVQIGKEVEVYFESVSEEIVMPRFKIL